MALDHFAEKRFVRIAAVVSLEASFISATSSRRIAGRSLLQQIERPNIVVGDGSVRLPVRAQREMDTAPGPTG